MDLRAGRLAFSAVFAAAAVIAACGTTSPSRSNSTIGADGASPSSAQTRVHDESLTFSRCVRGSGVPDFPDPPADGGYGLKSFTQQSSGQTWDARWGSDTLSSPRTPQRRTRPAAAAHEARGRIPEAMADPNRLLRDPSERAAPAPSSSAGRAQQRR